MKISIIIPVRNEEKYIEFCLNSVINALTEEVLEIIVIDGNSSDQTVRIVDNLCKKLPLIKLMHNPNRTVPYALNLGINESKGDFIMRLDAHTKYPCDYIQNCISAMNKTNSDSVGGIVVSIQNGDSLSAKIVQMLTTHLFGVGNSSFRLQPEPHYADTVPFGFFKKTIFNKIGIFDERLTRNQDYEFNQRIIKNGGKIWLDPKIKGFYKNQRTIMGLLKQAFGTGKWNVWMWKVARYSFKFRHAIPGFFSIGFLVLGSLSLFLSSFRVILLILLGVYFFITLFASIQQSFSYRVLMPVFLLPLGFFFYHFVYGIGIATGIYFLITGKTEIGKDTRPWVGAADYYAIKSH